MGLPASSILSRTDDLLNDESRIRWPLLERVRWINEAMGAIINRRPSAFAKSVVHSLSAGTAQTIPATGSILLDVVRNIGADGVTPGMPVRRTDRQLLDDSDPTWHTGKKKSVIKHFTFDDRAPKVFYCYPPAIAGTKVELLHAELPPDIAGATDTLDVSAEYLEAFVNYVCYRCYAKDSEYANGNLAAAFYQAFEASLGIKAQAENVTSPNQPNNSV